MFGTRYCGYEGMTMTLCLCGLPPHTHTPSLVMSKASDKSRQRTVYVVPEWSPSALSRSPKQGRSEKSPLPGSLRTHRTTEWNVVAWTRQEKDMRGNVLKGHREIKARTSVHDEASALWQMDHTSGINKGEPG